MSTENSDNSKAYLDFLQKALKTGARITAAGFLLTFALNQPQDATAASKFANRGRGEKLPLVDHSREGASGGKPYEVGNFVVSPEEATGLAPLDQLESEFTVREFNEGILARWINTPGVEYPDGRVVFVDNYGAVLIRKWVIGPNGRELHVYPTSLTKLPSPSVPGGLESIMGTSVLQFQSGDLSANILRGAYPGENPKAQQTWMSSDGGVTWRQTK